VCDIFLIRANELEDNAYSRQFLKGIIAIGTVGVDYSYRIREL
jgi:hypothetical protein